MTNLILVAFHACMGTFIAAGIVPAYADIAEDLGVGMQNASYLTSLQIAILGGAPLFWKPLSNRFGRRPIFLLSLICSLVCNIGCAKSNSYASLAACRALVAFFISPATAIGSAVVMETTFKKDRARYMGVWTLMITLGVPVGPFLFGFVTYRVGYQWIFWILAMVSCSDGGSSFISVWLTGCDRDRSMVANLSCISSLDRRLDIWEAALKDQRRIGRESTCRFVESTLLLSPGGNLFAL